jgi:cellulose biosynthesis protein BcsQ
VNIFALEGLGKLLNTIKAFKIHNPDLDIEVVTMFDSRLRLSNQVVEGFKTF